ncbi:MAG TPA: wax ester/triacylglycerol synthase family O-acyltransferase [Candidatus Margulisiibacteriota bacterium]|nr:wax ester/triacylglycerol synthase family O-acyltransferase [Candidatus Margulisiibacteriota bacterium]
MKPPAFERLSAQDSTFLVFENERAHMHVGGTALLEAGPLRRHHGGVDIERIRTYIGSRLHWIPRYRQRLAFVPIENHPVWVDDQHFNLNYHVRHACLPPPGDDEQLKQLIGRIMSQQLDRGKPLWEAWIVEGLSDDRVALVTKAHHCMVDGIASVDLLSVLLSPTPEATIETAPRWKPRPLPSQLDLLRDALTRRVAGSFELVRSLTRVLDEPDAVQEQLTQRARATLQMIGAGLRRPAATPINQPIGPHRRFDWLRLDLDDVKHVKNRLGGTINDVVLATVSGGLRQFLINRGVSVKDLDYRVVLPVSMRAPQEHGTSGNRVSAWITSLPVHERDPRRRLAVVRQTTAALKEAKLELGADTLTEVGELAGSGMMTLGVRLAARLHPYNLIVTNVPGPQLPLYLLGARMLEGYPQVPLFEYQGLGVALFSYAGRLCWGFNADWDLLPDLPDLVAAVGTAFRDLHATANRTEMLAKRRPPARHAGVARRRGSADSESADSPIDRRG